jgi:hypothetical protein
MTGAGQRKPGQDRVLEIPISEARPSPENDKLYRPVDPNAPDMAALAQSIRENGIMEPLVITEDGWILSGHRRRAAAIRAGLRSVPCRVEAGVFKDTDSDRFFSLLREYNRQREKTLAEHLREEVVSCNGFEAYQSLIEHRQEKAAISAETIQLRDRKERDRISKAKEPFTQAIKEVLDKLSEFLPLSVRKIHYELLNNPPLRPASKPDSAYQNDKSSYKNLVDLTVRMRLTGEIPMGAISDETRPLVLWDAFDSAADFMQEQLDGFMSGYWRNLLLSQPNHIELLCEKNTLLPIIKPVAMEYCIPITSGRGFCSIPPRWEMAKRFRKRGKESLVLLILSDFDPEGEEIAHSFARSMRDDFGVDQIQPVKVALKKSQVIEMILPNDFQAKEKSSRYKRFVARYGTSVHELEAVPPRTLQGLLRDAIDSVLDIEAFNHEID